MKLFEALNKMLFGFSTPKMEEPSVGKLQAFDIDHEDGAVEVVTSSGGVMCYGTNLFSLPTAEIELIKTYRRLANTGDVERILNDIRNEVFIFDVPGKKAVELDFDEEENTGKISKALMKKIREEYANVYELLDFKKRGLELFDRFYVDGRLFLHKIVDSAKQKEGIKKIIRIDPIKIRKVVEYPKPNAEGVYDLSLIKTYYVFSDINDVFNVSVAQLKIIHPDAIAYTDSGLYDQDTGSALSYLWKSIVPYNNMKMMEEALLIYRIVRSPERRVFYINVGNLSKPKAEQYIQELMAKFKNRLVYDSKTGSIVDKKNIMSMVEDYWIPRRDDGKGTEIQPLPGATNLGSIDDVTLFKNKFLESMGVPVSRFREDPSSFVFGRTTEISRDEYRFRKYIDRLRGRFMAIFEDILRTQLILKNIITVDDWVAIKKIIIWNFTEDNNFIQWKEAEVLNSQIETLTAIDQFVGKYFSRKYVLSTVMKIPEEEIDAMLKDAEEDAEAMPTPPGQEDGFGAEPAIPSDGLTGAGSTDHKEPSETEDEEKSPLNEFSK